MEARSASLPRPLNSLIGRDEAVRAVVELCTGGRRAWGAARDRVAAGDPVAAADRVATRDPVAARDPVAPGHPVAVVSLVGPAGAGKTRLAVAAATAYEAGTYEAGVYEARAYEAGVYEAGAGGPSRAGAVSFVDLTPVEPESDARVLAGAALDALELPRVPDRDDIESLCGAITGLLVLDNCEHVIEGSAALVGALRAAVPGLRILATSRQPLGVTGERVVPVEPLPVTVAGPGSPPTRGPAVALFRARLCERTGVAFPEEYADAAVEICRQLDGLPLAIELAAARAALLSVPEVRRLLAERRRGDVLRDAKGTGPRHHRTLREALDWSYQLLDPAEQAALRRLAVFRGGWTDEAAAALPGHETGLVAALRAKSLVAIEVHTGHSRYRTLQTVGSYAAARLAEHPEEETAARDAHAGYFVALAERGTAGLRGPDQRRWLRTLTAEQDNLRAAMTWLAGRPDSADDLRLAAALAPFHHLTGQYDQGRRWLVEAIGRRGSAPPEVLVPAYAGAASLAMLQCDYPVAAELAGKGLAFPDHPEYGRLRTLLGSLERERGRYRQSMRHLDAGRAFFAAAGDAWGEGRVAQLAGCTAWLSGDFDAALDLLGESLVAFRDLADDESAASTVMHLGAVAHFRGDPVKARRHLAEALGRFTELNFPEGIGWALEFLGRVDLADGDNRSGEERLRSSLRTHRRLGDRWRSASVLEALAEARRLAGDPLRAAALLGSADVVRDRIGAPTPLCERPARDRTVGALRTALGAGPFAVAYGHGRRTPLDELLDEARPVPTPVSGLLPALR